MVFKKDLIKLKYKIHKIRKDIKKLNYVKAIKMYKILRVNVCKYRTIGGHGQKFKFRSYLVHR